MKTTIIFGLFFLVHAICLVCTTFLIYNNKEGWGYLIFIQILLCCVRIRTGKKKNKKNKKKVQDCKPETATTTTK